MGKKNKRNKDKVEDQELEDKNVLTGG